MIMENLPAKELSHLNGVDKLKDTLTEYIKPFLVLFGEVATLTKASGSTPTSDFFGRRN